jgi:GT2 family glycosyltransferase
MSGRRGGDPVHRRQSRSDAFGQAAPDDTNAYVIESFIGTAHALRRSLFLQLGGYREELFHQGEESDLCIRLLAAGYVVRLGRGEPIHHFESPRRDFRRMDHYGPRNAILFAWQNVPFPAALIQIPSTIAGVLVHHPAAAPPAHAHRRRARWARLVRPMRACPGS